MSEIAERRGWRLDVYPLSPLLHNAPQRIAAQVEAKLDELRPRYGRRLAVGYADCGTYGALDEVCSRRGVHRFGGRHCYDLFAGGVIIDKLLDEEPGTYLLTDFLVRSFARTVVTELGLDRWPELRDDYFRHYRRVVWLTTAAPDAGDARTELRVLADRAAQVLSLPLEIVQIGDDALENELGELIGLVTVGASAAMTSAAVDDVGVLPESGDRS